MKKENPKTAQDVKKDLNGLQIMRNLARNMAFMIRAVFKVLCPIFNILQRPALYRISTND